jgi:hypothetical protein
MRKHPRPQAQARAALTVALVQPSELNLFTWNDNIQSFGS